MTRATPKPLVLAGLIALGIALVQALFILWFSWPAQNTQPKDLPIVIAGPEAATTQLHKTLTAAQPGAFKITVVADAAAADQRIRERKAYAAFIPDSTGLSLHLASAASPTVATLLTQAANQFAAKLQTGGTATTPTQLKVIDVVASPSDDPRGGGFTAGFLPLLMTSIACGALLLFLVPSHLNRVLGLAAFATLTGLIGSALLHSRGILTGPYLATAAAIGLITLAVSSIVSGLGATIGNRGILVSALTVFFVGNPISGMSSAPEFIPQPWGLIGQLLPPGAGAWLLRSTAFFHGNDAIRSALVLAAWAAVGLLLVAFGHFRDQNRTPETQPASPIQATALAA